MKEFLLSDLERLTAPHANEADECEALRFWSSKTIAEKLSASAQVTTAFYRWRGYDLDAPKERTLRRFDRSDEAHQREEQVADDETARLWKLFKESK